MSWLLRDNWLWALLAFLLGALITWLLLVRRIDTATEAESVRRPADDPDLVPAAAASTASAATTTPRPSVAATKPTDESDAKVTTVEPVLVAEQTSTNPKDDKAPTKAAEPAPTAKSPDAASTDTRKATTTGAELDEDVTPPDDSAESPPVAEQSRPDGSAGTPDDTRSAEPDDSAESSRSAPYGEGSAAALADGSAPEGFTIKGNADSMLYHTTDSPSYSRTKAEAWFRTEQDAERAGFTRWNRRDRSATDDKESVTAPAAGPTASEEPSPATASAAEPIEDVPPADDSAESSPAADQAKGAVPAQAPDGADTPEPNDSAESSDAADTRASTAADDSSGNDEGPTSVGTVATVAEPVVAPGAYGEGSADPLPDGSAPAGFTIKGNADSMLFHTTDSPYYGRTKAEVWFRTEKDAERAGFTHWDRN